MSKEKLIKDLFHYGNLVFDKEETTNKGFERTKIIDLDGESYIVRMLNGEVVTLKKLK